MGGGLMQLVAYGAQDVYLTGNPQITFFKVVYRRHTNFSVEPIQQVFNGSANFGRTVTCNLNRNGDLITNMYVVVKLDAKTSVDAEWGYVRRLGYALIEETKVEIGGSKIDEQYGDWLNIWHELSHKVGQERGHAKMIGDVPELTNLTKSHGEATLYVPLAFWFNRHNGLALPLIALQYHDVRVTVQYRAASSCVNYKKTSAPLSAELPNMGDSFLLIDYVFLDSEERKRFAQASHEYLIEQLQFTGSEALTSAGNLKYRLNFNHPCKFLVWTPQLAVNTSRQLYPVWATDGNWEAAREQLGKLLWAAAHYDISDNDHLSVSRKTVGSDLSGYIKDLEATNISEDANIDPDCVVITSGLESITSDLFRDLDSLVSDVPANAAARMYLKKYAVSASDIFNYGLYANRNGNPVVSSKLQLNGHDRFQERDGNYFNYVQPYQHFSNTPSDGVNVYSFALKPEDHQPSGTCNFSRIDNATLNVGIAKEATVRDSNLNIYTVNYNVLRVMSGMAGTAYSN
jgi:hypothetical protein